MSVDLYTGTPGSGKSYAAAIKINQWLLKRRNVISTMAFDVKRASRNGKRRIGKYEYVFIRDLTPKQLVEFAEANHREGKEGQTLIVIDECHILFNPREYMQNGRKEWLLFFAYHRHYGFDILLISQQVISIDKQIRGMIETEFRYRKINNRGMWKMLPVTVFLVIEFWFVNKTKVSAHFFRYRRSVARLYNSYEANRAISEKLGVFHAQDSADVLDDEPQAPAETDRADDGRNDLSTRGRRGWKWIQALQAAALK
jgi:zona occludens toxin (predicted ATPase)